MIKNKKQKYNLLFFAGLILALAFDQWTKWLAVAHLKGQAPFVIWDGVFELYYSENRGMAFGMLQGRQTFLLVTTLIVVILVLIAFTRLPAANRFLPMRFCLFFITAGAFGNMIDRAAQGYVVDFLYFKLIDFPIFNVADCYVTLSTVCLLLLSFFYYKEEEFSALFSRKEHQS